MHNHFKEEEKDKINIFINLALEFNKTHNIFSREGHDEVYKKDILDCEPLIKRIKNNTKCEFFSQYEKVIQAGFTDPVLVTEQV